MHQPIWIKSEQDLVVGDLVYFMKRDSAVGDAKGTMGMVEDINRGRDGIIIKYCNSSEQKLSLTKGNVRYTERALRKLSKIFSMWETYLAEDLAELSRKMKVMRKSDDSLLDKDDITAQISTVRPLGCKSKRVLQVERCCQEQCNLAMHFNAQVKLTT